MAGNCKDLPTRPYELIDFELHNEKVRFTMWN